MAILGNQQGVLQQVPIFNYEKTQETAKSINVRCDFALDTFYSGNLSQERQQGVFQSIRSIYFNCENCANDVTFTCVDTGQVLTFDAGTSGYLPVLVSQGMRFRFDGVPPDVALFNLLNVDMPPAIWPTSGGVSPPFPFSDIEMTGPALLGKSTVGLGAAEEITLGAGLSFVGDVLNMGAGGPYVLKAGDTMTGALDIDVVGPLGLTVECDVSGSPASLSNANLLVESQDGSNQGANFFLRHNTASPAASDNLAKIVFWGKNDTSLDFRYSQLSCILSNPVTGAEASRFTFANTIAGSLQIRFEIAAGLYGFNATGGDQGASTINAISYYANANLIADTNGLLRRRVFTFGTLPSAVGIAGAMAQISDGAAAPVWGAAAAGGGAVSTPVISDNAAWNNG